MAISVPLKIHGTRAEKIFFGAMGVIAGLIIVSVLAAIFGTAIYLAIFWLENYQITPLTAWLLGLVPALLSRPVEFS